MTDQLILELETMTKPTEKKSRSRRQESPPASDEGAKYTQRFSVADHAWFSALAARDKRSLNSWVYAAALKAAGLADPNYRFSPARKPKGP